MRHVIAIYKTEELAWGLVRTINAEYVALVSVRVTMAGNYQVATELPDHDKETMIFLDAIRSGYDAMHGTLSLHIMSSRPQR